MVAVATEICSLDRVRTELRIAPGDNDHDAMLLDHIEEAVAYIERRTGYPMVDRDRVVRCLQPTKNSPIVLRVRGLSAIKSIQYWSAAAHSDDPLPDGILNYSDLGGIDALSSLDSVRSDGVRILPPPAGWPEFLPNTFLRVTCVLGLNLNNHPSEIAFRQAVVMLVRQYYNGESTSKRNRAVNALLAPYVSRATNEGSVDYIVYG